MLQCLAAWGADSAHPPQAPLPTLLGDPLEPPIFALNSPLPSAGANDYAPPMDWQQIAALGVVGVTVTLMAWRLLRPRRLDFRKATHCGCGSTTNPVGLVITGRRGERPQIVFKNPSR